jgi:cyclophilin family peptidyl-prolyl cis-trans isomerase
MKYLFLVIGLLVVIGGFLLLPKKPSTPNQTQTTSTTPNDFISGQQATIDTDKGKIVIALYPGDAPKTVQNFATLAKRGYYNNLTFHRVEPGFVIQGGDPNGDGSGGTSIYGPTFADELNPNTQSYKDGYKTGVVAMANRGPDTNGSQFFILLADHPELPKAYTIFGKVTTGLDVMQKIQVGDHIKSITIQ